MTAFDLDRYLARIAWTGPRHASFETLAGVLRAHMTAIPFENLDVLLGRGVRLDIDSVCAKLVAERRGGYCFEHGTLFRAALEGLGFEPEAHTARVIMERPRAEAALTHMVLTVRVGGTAFVLDPGFGGHAPIVPVPLEPGQQVADETDLHRMARHGRDWVLEARVDGAMQPLWTSTLEPAEPVDFVMANHFVSTFPESPFVRGLMLRAIAPRGRVSMFNRDLTIRHPGGVEKSVIADRDGLHALLAEHFGFDLPDVKRLRVPSVPEWA
ncbi:MAG TPA: arylamine N-acetyltransferase [Vicinamibacterales bacterium]|nr:arylamine N-acetyltransferase [Vicinamibacterales bacterium]